MTEIKSHEGVDGSTVAITGGTGSFGHAMARHLLKKDVSIVRVFSRDEAKQDAMRRELNDDRLRFYIGDVRDADSVANALSGADYVFHAAALKQVPSCEFFPDQAVKTNVIGSSNVVNAAISAGARSVVCLSTDKAVHPVNAMGMSKALMEKTAQAAARNHPESSTRVAVTRYGNVLLSRGSVVPLFVQQIKSGLPMTLTEPTMTRFLMTLDESVKLVDYAFTNAGQGDLFVRKAPGASVLTIARAVASLMGDDDPEIKIIGVRHGEKMHETLLSSEELATASDQGEYFQIPLDARSLNYELYFDEGVGSRVSPPDYTSASTDQLDLEATKSLLSGLAAFERLLDRDGA